MEEIVLVWTTVPEAFDTSTFARALVEGRLAACVSVFPLQVSTYRWQGAIETAREHQVLMKTTADRVTALREALRRLHPNVLPEFLVVPAIAHEDFGNWVRGSVGP